MEIIIAVLIVAALSVLVVCSCIRAKDVLETPEDREQEDQEQMEFLNEWARKKGK